MNYKECGWKQLCITKYCAAICQRRVAKTTETSVIAVCVPTEIRIWHPPNASLKLYRCSPLSRFPNSSISHSTIDIVWSEINVVALLSAYSGRQPVLRVRYEECRKGTYATLAI
jgi:hypothetical protein